MTHDLWIRIEDRLPNHEDWIDVWTVNYERIIDVAYRAPGKGITHVYNEELDLPERIDNFTHWMPSIEPPQD